MYRPAPVVFDSRYHFGINLKKPQAKCFICGFKNLSKALSILCSISFKKARKLINECYELEIEEDKPKEIEKDENEFVKLYNSFLPLNKIHKQYLENRNFDPNKLEREWGLKASDNFGKYKYRIVAPITMNKRIVSFVGRDFTDRQPIRYLFCEDEKSLLPRRELCYNIDNSRDSIVIVEGVFDCWRIGKKSIALLSTQFTKEQILLITKRKFKNIFVMFDGEENAIKKAHELANALSVGCDHIEVLELDEGDPADLSEDDVRHLKKELGI